MEHDHTPEAIGRRLDKGPDTSYLRDWVYGGIDGAVTTFAVVTGVVGAELAPAIVVILGVANLLGDGFSMAASNYTGARAEQDEYAYLEAVERRHLRLVPEGERDDAIMPWPGSGRYVHPVPPITERGAFMKLPWIVALLVVGWIVAARSPVGLRVGNELRAVSDRVMLGFLRLTSEFEKEA